MIVKIPVTAAGIEAIEEATYRGVSINATVSFTLPQAIAIAEAVEREFKRREKEGLDISRMGPISVQMVGRLDDWMNVVAEKEGIITATPFQMRPVITFSDKEDLYESQGQDHRSQSGNF